MCKYVYIIYSGLTYIFEKILSEESLPETQWRWNVPGRTDNFSWPQFGDSRLPIRGVTLMTCLNYVHEAATWSQEQVTEPST